MEQSLTANELRYMAQNQMNSNVNHTLMPHASPSPYSNQPGAFGGTMTSQDPFQLLKTQNFEDQGRSQPFGGNQTQQVQGRSSVGSNLNNMAAMLARKANAQGHNPQHSQTMRANQQDAYQPRRFNNRDPYQQMPQTKIELSRILRGEREDQILIRQRQQQKFENFNRLLKNTAASQQME